MLNLETIAVTRAAIPLISIPILGLQNWHCMLMCGPQFTLKTSQEKNKFLVGKLFSYAIAGGIFGYLGEKLLAFSEVRLLGALIFVVYAFLTVLLVLSWFGKSQHFSLFNKPQFQHLAKKSSFLQGIFSFAIPCGVLFQMASLAVLSKTTVGGLLIGLSQGSMAAISLWYSSKAIREIFERFSKWRMLLKLVLILMIVFSLYRFASIVFFEDAETIATKLLCI